MIEILYTGLIETNSDLSICNFNKVDEFDKIIKKTSYKKEGAIILNNSEAWKRLYGTNSVVLNVAWNKMYKRELFDNIIFPIGKIHEDMYIMHRIFGKCKKIIILDYSLYYYLQRNNSITGEKFNLKKLDILGVFEDRVNYFGCLREETCCYFSMIEYLKQIILIHALTKKNYKSRLDILIMLEKKFEIIKENIKKYNGSDNNSELAFKEKVKLKFLVKLPSKFIFNLFDLMINSIGRIIWN
ncbi:MAG: Glycosyl transferase, family 2 [Clostridium butyricum DORA_1]|nr:MAG: Glycosyl transferase, family 2 [Clostridium butyricum DORA_1]